MTDKREKPLIGIVGVCAAGKTTLIASLIALGYNCRHIAQEHSYVKTMWKQLTNPDILVYLEASYPVTLLRRNLDWTIQEYNEQLSRLSHARENAEIIILTDSMTAEEVSKEAQNMIKGLINLD